MEEQEHNPFECDKEPCEDCEKVLRDPRPRAQDIFTSPVLYVGQKVLYVYRINAEVTDMRLGMVLPRVEQHHRALAKADSYIAIIFGNRAYTEQLREDHYKVDVCELKAEFDWCVLRDGAAVLA